MRILLDTHTLYWFIEGHPNLTQLATTMIGNPNNEILISPASYWEMAIKISLGKWKLNQSYQHFIDIALVQYEFSILPVTPVHTEGLIKLPYLHRDPFDRLIIAQSIIENVPIVSADTQFDAYGINRVW